MRTTALTLLFAATVVAGACSVDDGSGSDARSTTTSAAPTDTAETETTTTTTLPPSVGIVELDGVSHEIDATCYAPGAGEVLATGVAATDDGRIEVYLQAFLGEPYLGIAVTGQNTVVYEAAIDRPLEISYEADILRVDDIALVTDLDLETGVGTEAGVGSVVVECRAYESELPPGFVAG